MQEDPEFTEELISKICMDMRTVDILKSNYHHFEHNAEMKECFERICDLVNQMMEALTAEQLDIVLEEHKRQLEEIAKKKQLDTQDIEQKE